ncbi:DUF2381 family protein [Pyxidicoccus fallax]|uniref:DUF2381 family protein n=1 Tax=Pyxidicoccus fallax TaxID=394095 RepID=A0A848L5B7_9BACT|nr:DUF2381 family protein [Pyxidicoccus fallax]NMO13889.1 DUF2381 family protein [Pyxidicoccus fallax]NPC85192.1 DUF2381 family protein [Pyxidicoccus fallax]
MSPGSVTWSLILAWCLFVAVEARAQSRPADNEREVVLPEAPQAAAPEIRLPAWGTVIRFLDASINPGTIELEGKGTRVDLFDKGERSLIVVPVAGQGGSGQLRLVVEFTGGDSPTHAAFTLVLGAPEADERVAVVRRAQSASVLETRLREVRTQLAAREAELQACLTRSEATGPAGLALQDTLDELGVVGKPAVQVLSQDGLKGRAAISLRAAAWTLVAVTVRNDGGEPWTPTQARLVDAGRGRSVRVLGIRMKVPRIVPGAEARVAVETGAPDWLPGTRFHLELQDAAGRRLLIRDMEL